MGYGKNKGGRLLVSFPHFPTINFVNGGIGIKFEYQFLLHNWNSFYSDVEPTQK